MDVVKKKLNENFINLRIAHRGLHSETVSENSMEAFRLAIERGYAIEKTFTLRATTTLP